ncbi:TPA: hypothetical protein DEP34_01880 [Candidatus Uhrbacteria bacterium]|uniref:Transglycosylase SLT domain-containing protein n=2 Tax=Candidatus Uhriibacteriota TaxID=1752732 RepID=A0A0G1Q9M8_9BACT|nr:MAG: hypothetical protein UX45_C0010G0010 [Candidatus Uhrbacteria bacterium GW2011_GWF2_46_218]KKU41674.1 MAG: hypothetical protein UX57_C0002G0044 [Candidatus Uhrbacteria bacterium GW2011_GWE2_46_68]HBK33457.1 hypothetical protein [Candidatus Uhrbacteria bacterium]HCB19116.1 hypothetical protein [Candidatus Uhrbacteria bacterium]
MSNVLSTCILCVFFTVFAGCDEEQKIFRSSRLCAGSSEKISEVTAQTDPEVEVTVIPPNEEPTRDPEDEVLETTPLPPQAPLPTEFINLLTHTAYLPPGSPRQSDVPEHLGGAIKTGYLILNSMHLERSRCGGSGSGWRKCFGDYLIAATDAQGRVNVFSLYEGEEASHHFKVTCERKGGCQGGVNPSFHVESPLGWTVVAIRTAVRAKDDATQGAVYIPYSSRLDTPELRDAAIDYLGDIALSAYYDLHARQLESDFLTDKLVVDVGTLDHIIALILTEQMLHDLDFVNGDDAVRLAMLNRTLTIIGANRDRSFWYTRSRVGATGIGQIMPGTYNRLRERYDRAGLPEDREFGRLDHAMALKAMIIHADAELWPMSDEYRHFVIEHPKEGRLILAGGYNANVKRVYEAIKECGDTWREPSCKKLPAETRRYLIKYEWIYAVLFDPAFREQVWLNAFTQRAPQ